MYVLLLCRFFQGVFSGAPVSNVGGVLSDIWSPQQRGVAIVGYALATVGGPTIGPVVGSALVQSSFGWRWTQYVTGVFLLTMLLLDVVFLDESYPVRTDRVKYFALLRPVLTQVHCRQPFSSPKPADCVARAATGHSTLSTKSRPCRSPSSATNSSSGPFSSSVRPSVSWSLCMRVLSTAYSTLVSGRCRMNSHRNVGGASWSGLYHSWPNWSAVLLEPE